MDHSFILPNIVFAKNYSVPLVALSIVISIIASFTAFGISERAFSASNKTIEILWNLFGAIAMGFGIWAMHFVGMLALSLPVQITYDTKLTLLSVLPAIGACSAVFWLLDHDHQSCSRNRLLFGGILLGAGIGLMHYMGMAAMRLNAGMMHDTVLFYLSLIIAIILATIALKTHHSASEKTTYQFFSRKQLFSATVMGFATAGMHYTGMAAANFTPLKTNEVMHGMPTSTLSIIVSIVAFSILLAATLIPLLFRYKQTALELARMVEKDKAHQQVLERMAHYDLLTQLPNRGLFADRFGPAIARCNRTNTLLAICFLDLDDFKPVNDQYGHEIGDLLLIEVAKRVKLNIRAEDTVSRQGGDEFTMLLADIESVEHCEQMLTRILRALSEPYLVKNHALNISASLGVTLYPIDSANLDTLIRHADQAMYQAKSAGRNTYRFFELPLEKLDRQD